MVSRVKGHCCTERRHHYGAGDLPVGYLTERSSGLPVLLMTGVLAQWVKGPSPGRKICGVVRLRSLKSTVRRRRGSTAATSEGATPELRTLEADNNFCGDRPTTG